MRRALSVALLAVALIYSLYALGAVANIIIHATNPPIFDNNGQPWPILNIVQAENYDTGGEGVAFHRAGSCGATPGLYRTGSDWDNIAAEGTQYGIACNQIGDWQRTTVSVPTQGTQQFSLSMAATGSSVSGHNNVWEIDTCDPTCTQLTTVSIASGTDGVFGIFQSPNFTLSAGTHVIRRFCQSAATGFCSDVDYMQAAVGGSPTISSLSVTPTSFSVPVSPPTTIAQIAASCTGGSCAGATFAMGTNGSCAGTASADNGKYTTVGSNLNIAQTISSAETDHIGIAATLSGATNSGVCFAEQMQAGGAICDIGPNYAGTIPGPATKAGLTYCAANFDFSQALPANFFGLYNGTYANSGSTFYQVDVDAGVNILAGNNIGQNSDPSTGRLTWHIHWDHTLCLPHCSSTSGTRGLYAFQTQSGPCCGLLDFPQGHYVEVRFRFGTPGPWGFNNQAPDMAVWEWSSAHSSGASGNSIERDWMEVGPDAGTGSGSDSATHLWGTAGSGGSQFNCCNINGIGGFGGVYHTVGMLATTNGTNTTETCFFLDGALQAACAPDGASTTAVQNFRQYLIVWFGNYSVDNDLYIDYMRVFSCPSWATTQCAGNIVTTYP